MAGGGFSQHLMHDRPSIGRFIIQKTFLSLVLWLGFFG
jgi:hypothetical protein